jgi:hypothetical protein
MIAASFADVCCAVAVLFATLTIGKLVVDRSKLEEQLLEEFELF